MKPFRLLLIGFGAALVLFGLVAVVAFNSSFQTWAARKAIASQPGMVASVGSVSAGMASVKLSDLRWKQVGSALTVPTLEVDVPLWSAAVRKNVKISRLVAKGWTLDLTNTSAATVQSPAASSAPSAAPPATAAMQAFAGVFSQLQLPVDVALDGVELEGNVILPESRGNVAVRIKGGGLAAGREGNFDLAAAASLTDPAVNRLDVVGALGATMDSPRTFTRLAAKVNAAASGAKFPDGVKLTAEAAATRGATGESYTASVVTDAQEIARITADFPRGAQRLDGTWKIDVRDSHVAPFAFGKPLPAFTAVGAGKFDTDASFTAVHANGRLNGTADRLQVIRPELAGLGELKIAADFDLAERAGTLTVQKVEAAIAGNAPIMTVRSLQAFEFNPSTRELRAADTARELLGVTLHGVPVAWTKPFIKDFEVTGGHVRGDFVAIARGGGMAVRSIAPLTVDKISVTQLGKLLLREVDMSSQISADYTPQGWQAEITALKAKSGAATLVTLDAKAGQLAGKGQPLKATGKIATDLIGVLAQPAALAAVVLTSGDATAEFAASFNGKGEFQAKVVLQNLATLVDKKAVKLPNVSADVRADFPADGKIVFSAPLVIERDQRRSDLTLAGSVSPLKDKVRTVEANVTSTRLVVEDAQILGAMLPPKPEKKPEQGKAPAPDEAPPWSGLSGSITLQLKKVIYSDTFEANNVAGRLRIDAGMLKLEGMQAGIGDGGRANVNGTVTFTPAAPQPYGLMAEVAVREFDPGPLFRALNSNQPATVEGKFDIESKLNGRAMTLADLALGAGGSFQLTSRGGVFRGLPVNVSTAVESTSKVASWIASAGTAISAMTGKKEYADVVSKVQAVTELAKGLNPIPYDQLSVVVSRDAALNTTLKNFTLISPEMRLTGGGTALHKAGASILDDSLAMEFTLRARGRQGELLRLLGALEAAPDDFGYAACTVPLKVAGTLGKPDTSELNGKLAALALEKSGMTDKAADLFNKLIGGGSK